MALKRIERKIRIISMRAMRKIIIIIFCLSSFTTINGQNFYCTKDSVPIYSTRDVQSKVVGWINKNDTVLSFKETKYRGSITWPEKHLTEIFLWGQVKTMNRVEGWVHSSWFVQKLYSPPTFNLWNFDSYDNADHIYHIGWSKDGKYYAYIVSGYIDGGVDGLTVRFYVINTTNNKKEEELEAYTSYDTPIDDAWKDDYSSIQSALNDFGIIQDTNHIQMNPIPIKTSKGVPISISFELSDTLNLVNASYLNSNNQIANIHQYIASIYCIGWMKSPYDENKFIVYTSANIGSSEYYGEAFAVDLNNFKR